MYGRRFPDVTGRLQDHLSSLSELFTLLKLLNSLGSVGQKMAKDLLPTPPPWAPPVVDQLGGFILIVPVVSYLALIQAVRFRTLEMTNSKYP